MKIKKVQPWTMSKSVLKERSKRLPPTAPTKLEKRFYEKYAKKALMNKNSLVLGATPELRDILLNQGYKNISVDISDFMLEKYSALMKNRNHPNETIIKRNWLDMNYNHNFFGIVFGDGSFINLSTKSENKKLFSILSRIIIPKGFLILRHLVLNEGKTIPLKKLVKLYRDSKITLGEFYFEMRAVNYLDKVYNKKTYQYNAKKNFELIEQYYKKGILTKKERDELFSYKIELTNSFYPEKRVFRSCKKERI